MIDLFIPFSMSLFLLIHTLLGRANCHDQTGEVKFT